MWEHRRKVTVRELLPWLPTAAGVCGLVALLIFAAVQFTSTPEVPVTAAPAPAAPYLPPYSPPSFTPSPLPSLPLPPPSPPVPPPGTIAPVTSPAPRPSVTSSKTPAATRPPALTGAYRVVESFGDGFIGEVLIRNASGRDLDWRADLRFPDADRLITSWVESAPQATLTRSGNRFVWSSGVPVPAGGEVALRFHFGREGTVDRPASCLVNGTTCTNLR
ncbi:MAG: cellulose binding domain-containing protein [Actinoplanes sp.]